jgi:hypothetical protein
MSKKAMFFRQVGGGFTTEYQAILDEATTLTYTLPSGANQTIQNQIIVDMKADGLWATTDAMFYFKGDGDSDFKKINWKNPTGAKAVDTGVTPLTYASDGLLGNDVNYLDLGWNPTDDGTNYLQNDFSVAIDIVTVSTTDTSLLEGLSTASARSIALVAANTFQYYHSSANGSRSIQDLSTNGYFILDFLTNTTYASKNGAASFDTETGKTTDSFPITDLGLLKNGSSGRGTAKIGSIILGGSLDGSTTNYTNLYNALNSI